MQRWKINQIIIQDQNLISSYDCKILEFIPKYKQELKAKSKTTPLAVIVIAY